jgi:hypothetical protein
MTVKKFKCHDSESEMTAEMTLAMSCLGGVSDRHGSLEFVSVARRIKDWSLFLGVCEEHKILPLVYRHIASVHSNGVPWHVLAALRARYLSNMARCVYLSGVLETITKLFEGAGIVSVPFKGLVLSEFVYGDPALRSFSDLDILVPKQDAVKARNLLIQNGFVPDLEMDDDQAARYVVHESDFVLTDNRNSAVIELHWDLDGKYLCRDLTLDFLKHHVQEISVDGWAVRFFQPEMLLVYQCIHSCKHIWENIEQIVTISALMKKDIRWDRVEAIADRLRCRRMVFLGLILSCHLLGDEIPAIFVDRVNDDKGLWGMADDICRTVLGMDINPGFFFKSYRFSLFHLKIRDSWPDRIRYALYLLISPSRKEWLYFPLPSRVSFLHFFLRPVRLFHEYAANRRLKGTDSP